MLNMPKSASTRAPSRTTALVRDVRILKFVSLRQFADSDQRSASVRVRKSPADLRPSTPRGLTRPQFAHLSGPGDGLSVNMCAGPRWIG